MSVWAIGDLDPVPVRVALAGGSARVECGAPAASSTRPLGPPPAARAPPPPHLAGVCMLLVLFASGIWVAAYLLGYAAGSAATHAATRGPSSLAPSI
jgi:hypothetical protein